ncbi:dihydroneopterin aldolase [Candidatus Poriferisocius sp.]|uniref:dihydroneopterin aldolase n=1 Tax=Candidatus Poriferisocius sp. TaxID=3101276 RepID=UPI003B59156B
MTEDRILLQGLRVMALCGALPEERDRVQPFELDIEIGADLAPSGSSDDLGDTVDYGAVCAAVAAASEGEQFTLMEAMAQRVASVCLGADRRVVWVTVEVRKLRPPVPQHLSTSGVRITRHRQ